MSRRIRKKRQHVNNQDDGNNEEPPEGIYKTDGRMSTQPNPSNQKSDNSNGKWYNSIPWWRILEGSGLIAGIIYAYVTYMQWQDLRQNFVVDQRAWVGLSDATTIGGKTSADLDMFSFDDVSITIRNSGKTPAIHLNFATVYTSTPESIPIPDIDSIPGARLVASPGEQVLAPGATATLGMSKVQGRTRDSDGFHRVIHYILGKVTYNDIFSQMPMHTTKFCLVRVVGNSFVPCPSGHHMD